MTERQGADSGRSQPLTVVCHLSNCDHYLTVEQAAGHLELGQQALLDLLDRGELPAEKVRGAYRIPPSAELADMWSEAIMKRFAASLQLPPLFVSPLPSQTYGAAWAHKPQPISSKTVRQVFIMM